MWCRICALVVGLSSLGVVNEARGADQATAEKELVVRLDFLRTMPSLRPGIASKAYLPFLQETRDWLAKKESQEALFHSLSELSTPRLVTLWDVFWVSTDTNAPLNRPKDMNSITSGFASRFNRVALAVLASEKDPVRRRLLINMIEPQVQTLTDEQAAAFKILRLAKPQ